MKNKLIIIVLFFITHFSFGLELDFNFTNLWSNSSGNAFNYNYKFIQNTQIDNQNFLFGMNVNLLNSTLDFFQNQTVNAKFNFEYKNDVFYTNSNIILTRADKLFIKTEEQEFLINDIKNFCINNSLGIKFNNFEISPFVLFSVINESDGEFYYFDGKIEIPIIRNYGFNFKFYNNLFCFQYHEGTLNLFNTTFEPLGALFANNYNFKYKYNLLINDFHLNPFIGYSYFSSEFVASLTNQNQKFLFFPFIYANVNGDLFAHILNLGLDFNFEKKYYNFVSNLNSIFFLNQDGKYIFDYLFKKNLIFDGSSGTEESKLDFVNHLGLIILDLKSEFLVKFPKISSSVNISKTFIIPFYFGERNKPGTRPEFKPISKNDILSYLLSGTKIGIKFEFH